MADAITSHHVQVDGRIITNPRAHVRADAAVRITEPRPLRGERKLAEGLDALCVEPVGMVVADLGAAAGGFTRTLLHRGARRVYAVDVGHGQLLGSLRQDQRVVNPERTNIADVEAAINHATTALENQDWTTVAVTLPTATGANGAVEGFVHAATTNPLRSAGLPDQRARRT